MKHLFLVLLTLAFSVSMNAKSPTSDLMQSKLNYDCVKNAVIGYEFSELTAAVVDESGNTSSLLIVHIKQAFSNADKTFAGLYRVDYSLNKDGFISYENKFRQITEDSRAGYTQNMQFREKNSFMLMQLISSIKKFKVHKNRLLSRSDKFIFERNVINKRLQISDAMKYSNGMRT